MFGFRKIFEGEIGDMYIYETLRTFGIQLISVFIPIYIASNGFGFRYVLGFLVLEQLSAILLSAPLSYMIAKNGFKKALVASYVFLIPALLLIQKSLSPETIAVSAVLYSVAQTFHSLSFESEFAVSSDAADRDRESGLMIGLPNVSRILGPLTGGFLLSFLGFNMLVSTSVLFFLGSGAVLFRTEDHRDPLDYGFRKLISDNLKSSIPVFFFRGIMNISAVTVFGLFVYYFVGSTLDVGIVSSIDNLGVVITALVSGKVVARLGRAKLIILGTALSAAVHFSRIFVSSPLEAAAVSGLGGIFFMIYEVPLFSKYAEAANEEDILEFYTLKRVFFKSGQMLTVLLILSVGIVHGLKTGFKAGFVLAGLSTILMAHFSGKDW